MIRKKTKHLWIIFLSILLAGAGIIAVYEKRAADGKAVKSGAGMAEAERIMELYHDIYERAAEAETLNDVTVMRQIVERLGEHGFTAVDGDNQVDMANAECAEEFIRRQENGEKGSLKVIRMLYADGFAIYDMETEDGKVSIVRGYYEYEDGRLKNGSVDQYDTDFWEYTEEGYLLFEGRLFSDEMYAMELGEMSEHAALRVKPLDEKCRDLNRRYILPVGYGRNNLFLFDWNEKDFEGIDFQDMFDIFYPKVYGKRNPYAEKGIGTGEMAHVPEEEFEHVIQSYFKIESGTLRTTAAYFPEDESYGFQTRGMDELETPQIPYPEVVRHVKNSDGTLTLTVNAVYPDKNLSKAYSHEVTVRPLPENGVQYVSNHIIPSENNDAGSWHKDRLAEAGTPVLWVLPQAEKCLLTEEEKKELQAMALEAGEQVKDVYRDIEVMEGASFGSNIREFTEEQRIEAAELLGRAGFTSVTEDRNMENPEKLEEFYSAYERKQNALETVVRVNKDGLLGIITFVYRNGSLQTYYVGVRWREGGIPELNDTSVSDVEEINLTEKGYFIYAYKIKVEHAALRQYWRVKPLSDELRKLTETYVSGLSYVNYNMLVKNWDAGNVEEILRPGLFDDLYRMYTGESFQPENGRIPAETFEKIMTAYLPVSIEQLRTAYEYEEAGGSYLYERVSPKAHPPFGEAVDYWENPDGTLTLIVDGLWPDYNSDCAFTNQITVRPFSDGTFRYLSNSIEQKELPLPPAAGRSAGFSQAVLVQTADFRVLQGKGRLRQGA